METFVQAPAAPPLISTPNPPKAGWVARVHAQTPASKPPKNRPLLTPEEEEKAVAEALPTSGFDAFMAKHSVSVYSGLQLLGQGFMAMSGHEYKNWARTGASLVNASGTMVGALYGHKPQAKDYEDLNAGQHIKHAFDPKNHIRQTLGLTALVGGALTATAGVKGMRWSEMASGVVAAISGANLMFADSNAKAWERSSVMNLMLLTPLGFAHAIESKDKWVLAAETCQGLGELTSYVYTRKTAEKIAQKQEEELKRREEQGEAVALAL